MFNDFSQDFKNVFNSNPFYVFNRYFFLTFYGILKYLPTPIGDIVRAIFLKFYLRKISTMWIREGVTFHFPENISIGNSVLSEFVYLNGYGGIDIGDMVLIGAGSKFYSHDHAFDDLSKPIRLQGLKKKPIIIKDNVFIGCNAVVLGNVTINEGAIVAACSVVTSNVPENTIVAGIPAKIIGMRGKKSDTESIKCELPDHVSTIFRPTTSDL